MSGFQKSQDSYDALYKSPEQSIHQQDTGEDAKQLDKPILSNIQNGDEVNFYFEKLLRFDNILMLLHTIALTLIIFYTDADFEKDSKNIDRCLQVLLFIQVLTLVVTYLRYKTLVDLEISRFQLTKLDNLWSSDKWGWIVIEVVLILSQPCPFINDYNITTQNLRDDYEFDFKINYVLSLFSFMKLLVIVRIMLSKSYYMTPRANRVCKMYEANNDYLYAIKGLFMDTPMMLIGVSFLVSIAVFSLALRICERNLLVEDPLHGVKTIINMKEISNAVWFTIITMTTVGYGDFYPKTMIGRIVDVILIIWGSVIVSLMVVVLTNFLTMDMSEKRAVAVLNRLDLKKCQKTHAVNYIANYWRKHCLTKNKLKPPKTPLRQVSVKQYRDRVESHNIKQHNYAQEKKEINKQMQNMLEIDDLYEQLTRQFDSFMDEVDISMENQNKVMSELNLHTKKPATGQSVFKRQHSQAKQD